LSVFSKIIGFLIARKKLFLGPLIFIFIALGGLFVLSGMPKFLPFIYALF